MPKNNKIVKQKVIASRFTENQIKRIQKALDDRPVTGIASIGTMARKLLLDYAYDRLTWRSKKERERAPEMYLPNRAETVRSVSA